VDVQEVIQPGIGRERDLAADARAVLRRYDRFRATLGAGVLLAALLPCADAAAAPFGAASPLAGLGSSASSIALSSSAVGADGGVLIAATRSAGGGRQAIVAIGRAGGPIRARPLAPAGAITSQPRAVLDDSGHGGVVFAAGKAVYLSVCRAGACAAAVKVGTSALSPDPDVAVQPGTRRLTVIWRGRARSGSNRLQWRIATGGTLGAVHTLGEFGNAPRIGTDAAGRSVAVWTRYAIHASDPQGLRTATRRRGEFARPITVQAGGVYSPQLVTGADGETIVAWLASSAFDVQSPRAQVRGATRTANTSFSAPADVGGADSATMALDRASDGRAVLALDRQLADGTTVVQAAVRAPRGTFSAPQDLAAPSFVSTAFGARAAIDDQGVATVAWSSGAGAATAVFAARSRPGDAFAAPQALLAGASGAPQQPPVVAAAGSRTVIAWTAAGGVVVADATG
jgi:hypothetical protein